MRALGFVMMCEVCGTSKRNKLLFGLGFFQDTDNTNYVYFTSVSLFTLFSFSFLGTTGCTGWLFVARKSEIPA